MEMKFIRNKIRSIYQELINQLIMNISPEKNSSKKVLAEHILKMYENIPLNELEEEACLLVNKNHSKVMTDKTSILRLTKTFTRRITTREKTYFPPKNGDQLKDELIALMTILKKHASHFQSITIKELGSLSDPEAMMISLEKLSKEYDTARERFSDEQNIYHRVTALEEQYAMLSQIVEKIGDEKNE